MTRGTPLPPSLPSLPLVTQRIHSPFQPKQSPSLSILHMCVIAIEGMSSILMIALFNYEAAIAFVKKKLLWLKNVFISRFYSCQIWRSSHAIPAQKSCLALVISTKKREHRMPLYLCLESSNILDIGFKHERSLSIMTNGHPL